MGVYKAPSVALDAYSLNILGNANKTPTLSDYAVQQAKAAQLGQSMAQSGRRQTFLTGPMGDASQAPIGTKTLLGG